MSVMEAGDRDVAMPATVPIAAGRSPGCGPAKRLLDIAVAATMLGLLAPLLLLIGLAVRLETRGPALFRQRRCGAGHRDLLVRGRAAGGTCGSGHEDARADRGPHTGVPGGRFPGGRAFVTPSS